MRTKDILIKLENEAKRFSNLAGEIHSKYNKKQKKIKDLVLKDISDKLYVLENERKGLREKYLNDLRIIRKKITDVKRSRRIITKEAYLKDKELQELNKNQHKYWDEAQNCWQEYHNLSNKLTKEKPKNEDNYKGLY